MTEHAVGAVDEGKALLLGEDDRFQAMRAQSCRGRHKLAFGGAYLSFAHDRECDVGEGREITGAAEAAVLLYDRCQAR